MIGAITGLVLAFGGNDHSDSENTSAPATGLTGGPTTQPTTASPADAPIAPSGTDSRSPSEASAPTAAVSPDPTGTAYTLLVRIAEMGPDLDANPPAITDNPDVRLGQVDPPRLSDSDIGDVNPPPLAVWPGPGMPTRQQCATLVSTQGIRTVEVKKGTVVCLRTDGGRIAVLTITSTTNEFSTGVMAQASVWPEVSDPS